MKFEEVYKASAQKVYRFLFGLSQSEDLAEELTAETFYQAFLHKNQFKGNSSIDTWLCQIAKNLFYKEMNRSKRFSEHAAELTDNEDSLFLNFENRQIAVEIHKVLRTLNETYKEVFTLHLFAELTFKEIAEIYGKSDSWAKMTFYRAKAELIKRLEDKNEY